MEKVNFKAAKYDTDLIIGTYKLEYSVENCSSLRSLTDVQDSLSLLEKEHLEKYRARLLKEGDYWNEEELKMHFLAHVFDVANIDTPKKIKLFYERILKAEIEGQEIFVKCDCMIATPFGVNTPNAPYFFLQVTQRASLVEEFKKAKKPDDPEGQMLLAMIAAQHKNANGKPIFGCWLQGRNWVFSTLTDKKYCVSSQYDATIQEELWQIVSILKNLKSIILGFTAGDLQ